MPSGGVRALTVISEFKPFGLTVEALDGFEPSEGDDDYHYFLFDPRITKSRTDDDSEIYNDDDLGVAGGNGDHELFIRGNRILWSTGRRLFKIFTLPSKVIKVCWCQMSGIAESLLCVLQVDKLTIYGVAGEVASVPLPHAMSSIWPLPHGLLLQRAPEGTLLANISQSVSNPLLSGRDIFRAKRDVGYSPQHSYPLPHLFDFSSTGDGKPTSSHLFLKDPLQDPQVTYIEERGKFNLMQELDERTIWTSDCIPLMVSYNKGKVQHSLWVVEVSNSNPDVDDPPSNLVAPALMAKHFLRRIWQGKGSQSAASKVFLATDDGVTPIICFLLREQSKLLSLRLQSLEINDETVYDIEPDISWTISAIAAAAVTVTRPIAKEGKLPLRDVIVLTPENTLLLYSGKLCLCKYVMPLQLAKEHPLNGISPLGTSGTLSSLKVVDLADAVRGRVNLVLNNRQVFKCALRLGPSSSLTNDCIASMSEGLSADLYNHFLDLLWSGDGSNFLAETDSTAEADWESFCNVIRKMCHSSRKKSNLLTYSAPDSSWEFLVKSKYNNQYSKSNHIAGWSPIFDLKGVDSCVTEVEKENADDALCLELLKETLHALHSIYETLKLDTLRKRDMGLLVLLLCDVADFLHEVNYLDYYKRDFPVLLRDMVIPLRFSTATNPPSLFRWLEHCLQHGSSFADVRDLPLLICKDGIYVVSWARKIVVFYSILCGADQSGNRLSSGVTCNIASGSYNSQEELMILAMVGENFSLQQLEYLPAGISLPLRHAIDRCRDSPPTNWPVAGYVLLGREDLALQRLRDAKKYVDFNLMRSNLISMSIPYMLPLHPVTIPSVSDSLEMDDDKLEDSDTFDGSVSDGMEHIFNSSSLLRFGRDLRLNEVRRLLCSARPVVIPTLVNPTASDQDAQQTQLWHLAHRTTALPFGRGAFTLGTIYTLLTEALAVPKLVLAGRLPAQQNAMVNLDPSFRNIQELKSWPEFHNAVAAGLRLSPLQGKMSRTWILYNKPDELNATHAGLLLALGLHGHLRILTITDIFKYYSQEHEFTTVGLMIGLAASYRGTMQPSISKSLYVHLPSHHSSSYPELELPTLIQSAALLSVGLIYESSAHPQTMQFLLSEIGRRSGGDNVLEREGYSVSAGFALGLVALGRGKDALGPVDGLLDRLFQYINGKELHNDRVHLLMASTGEHNRNAGQIIDGNLLNIDVTAPGAVIALALMFLKTESELVASRLSIPQTQFDLQYTRPDFILLRVVARNLILWSRIQPSEDWIESQFPEVVRKGLKGLENEMDDMYETDSEVFVQAYVNIVVGACIALGLRFAGTRDGNAQELLYKYATYFLHEIKPVGVSNVTGLPKGLSAYVDRGTLETCLHLIVLSLSVVMAGSGHLQTFRFLKFLRCRNSVDGYSYFGTQMAVSLAMGFLFLGDGMRTFSTSNSSISALLITLYPRLPAGPNDNRCHLQAFRHLYVIATEGRWIQTVDVDTGLPVYVPLEITIRETQIHAETSFSEVTPCILPERSILKAVRVCGPRYWPQVIELLPEEKAWWDSGDRNNPFRSGVLYVKRKIGACSYADDPIGSQSLLSRAMHKMIHLSQPRSSSSGRSSEIAVAIDQLVSTFSSDPSLIAFAQLFADSLRNGRSDVDFREFCLQVLFDCVSKDRPSLLQVYLTLYTTLECMIDLFVCGSNLSSDSLSLSSLKIALAYIEALSAGRLSSSRGEIVQSTFLGSLKKQVEELLSCSKDLKAHLLAYIESGAWPNEGSNGRSGTVLSWYLQWYNVPSSVDIKKVSEKIKRSTTIRSYVPLLRLLFPRTHVSALQVIDQSLSS